MPGAGDTETVTVIRPPGNDEFGDPLPGTAVEFEVPGCLFAPGPSKEMGFAAATVDTDGTVYSPPGTDVLATDRVRVRGVVYSVVGHPQDWGRSAGVVIVLRRVTG
jgi:hypothetical protein